MKGQQSGLPCNLWIITDIVRNLLFWQRRPSGKQSFPVPLSSSLPQSSGNSLSFPVACGVWVPSSTNFGPPPKNLITGFNRFCSGRKISNPNWALALWTERERRRRARGAGEIFMSRLSWKDWCGHVRSDRMRTGLRNNHRSGSQWRHRPGPGPPDRTGEVKDCTDLGAPQSTPPTHQAGKLFTLPSCRAEQPQPQKCFSKRKLSEKKKEPRLLLLAVKLAIKDRWNSSPSLHLSRATHAGQFIYQSGWEQQAPVNCLTHADILKMVDQISAERSESYFLTPEQSTIHHYCGSGSYLPPHISRCLVDIAITIIALSANTITLGMSTPQHNWGPSFLSDVVVVILQRILCVAHCLCQLQGRSGGKNVNDVILSHIYILHSLRSPSQRPNVKHKIEQSLFSVQSSNPFFYIEFNIFFRLDPGCQDDKI